MSFLCLLVCLVARCSNYNIFFLLQMTSLNFASHAPPEVMEALLKAVEEAHKRDNPSTPLVKTSQVYMVGLAAFFVHIDLTLSILFMCTGRYG
jgi:hypothetical protein